MDNERATKIVRREWDAQGACASCGYHGSLYEYEPLEFSIYIDETRKRIELRCLNDQGCRGVRIYYNDHEGSGNGKAE